MSKNKASPLFLINLSIVFRVCFFKRLKQIKTQGKLLSTKAIVRRWEKQLTLSIISSMTVSFRFIPDSASVATTICFTWTKTAVRMMIKCSLIWNLFEYTSCRSMKPCCLRSYSWNETATTTYIYKPWIGNNIRTLFFLSYKGLTLDFVIYRCIGMEYRESSSKLLKPKYSIVLCVKQIKNLQTKWHMLLKTWSFGGEKNTCSKERNITRSANKLSFLFVLNNANWNSSWTKVLTRDE